MKTGEGRKCLVGKFSLSFKRIMKGVHIITIFNVWTTFKSQFVLKNPSIRIFDHLLFSFRVSEMTKGPCSNVGKHWRSKLYWDYSTCLTKKQGKKKIIIFGVWFMRNCLIIRYSSYTVNTTLVLTIILPEHRSIMVIISHSPILKKYWPVGSVPRAQSIPSHLSTLWATLKGIYLKTPSLLSMSS